MQNNPLSLRPSKQRRRYQSGQLIEAADRWEYRWREYYIDPADGKEKTKRRWDVLAMKPMTKREAQRLLAEKMEAINRPGAKPLIATSFSSFADKWMKDVMIHKADSTQGEERRQIERDLKPLFGHLPMRDISAEMLQGWVSGMNLAAKTVHNRVGTFRSMWTTAKAWGYVSHDPFEALVLPTADEPDVYFFSAEEMMQIIEGAKGWYGLFFELLAKTGMRPGEAGGLRPEDVEGRVIHIRQTVWKGKVRPRRTKTKSSVRDFVISDALADKLRSHVEANPNRHGLIFVNQAGNPMNMDHFNQKVLRPLLERLGIWEKIQAAGVRCGNYAFRHGNMTALDRGKVPLKTIQARVGHSAGSKVTRSNYIHAVSADDVAAAELMEELLSPKRENEAVQ